MALHETAARGDEAGGIVTEAGEGGGGLTAESRRACSLDAGHVAQPFDGVHRDATLVLPAV